MRAVHDTVDASMQRLFRRYVELAGFSIQDLDDGLSVAEVSVYPDIGDAGALRDEIVANVLELLDERPEAYELLRGRTFARSLH